MGTRKKHEKKIGSMYSSSADRRGRDSEFGLKLKRGVTRSADFPILLVLTGACFCLAATAAATQRVTSQPDRQTDCEI